jgi:phosphatidylinositol alpha-1,6-mannosyltransferase
VVAHHHHLDPSPLNPLIEKRVIDAVDTVVVGSEFSRRQLREALGARTDHVAVVPYGVDPRFAPRPSRLDLVERWGLRGRQVVLFFGGLKPRKNLETLLDVWTAVAPAHRNARLLVAGGGVLLDELRRRTERLELAGSVVFTGYVPEADKADYFNLADVFFFPSAMEGFGLAVGEAMSSGLPVVASNRGSIPELVVDGEGGFVSDPTDPARFAERLRLLLDDAALRRKLGQANAARIEERFRWDRCVDGTRRVYEATLEAWRRRAAGSRR